MVRFYTLAVRKEIPHSTYYDSTVTIITTNEKEIPHSKKLHFRKLLCIPNVLMLYLAALGLSI